MKQQKSIRAIALSVTILFTVGCQQASIPTDSVSNKEDQSFQTNEAPQTSTNSVKQNSANSLTSSESNPSSQINQEKPTNEVNTENNLDTLVKQDTGSSLTGKVSDLDGLITDLNGRVTANEIVIPLPADILFDFDKANIRNNAIPTLEKLEQVIANSDTESIQINGHTDSKGSEPYNLQLSQARAKAVATWLSDNTGISSDRLKTKGYGESQPVANNQTPDGKDNPEGRTKNRRVEVIISKK
ncbi:MAG: OmpA family protein [Cyanobacteria bacterium P01_G01_bin.49]